MTNIIVQNTIEAWQPFYKEKISEMVGKEIQNTIVDFSNLVIRWNKKEEHKEQAV